MKEKYLGAEEVTVTVMPPGTYEPGGHLQARPSHRALLPVEHTAHAGGIAAYNGVVAATANSRVVPAPRRDGAAYVALAGEVRGGGRRGRRDRAHPHRRAGRRGRGVPPVCPQHDGRGSAGAG